MEKVLITGGTGLIGQHLSRRLLDEGYEIAFLSRQSKQSDKADIASYFWNVEKNILDRKALESCDYIIHLAGVNIGGKRWTEKRKNEIVSSRIQSAELILKNIDKQNHKLKAFISASAIGYYGALTSEKVFDEASIHAQDFLGNTCYQWERSADRFAELGIRVVKIRTGIVLSQHGGALPRLSAPARIGLGSGIGSGNQYTPWIHIDDLCSIYLKAMKDTNMMGPYNASAPEHITNAEFVKKIAEKFKKPFWLPNVPSFLIKMIFGKMSEMLLYGSRVSSKKIETEGFHFQYPTLNEALKVIYN